jgi:hypothetical protein
VTAAFQPLGARSRRDMALELLAGVDYDGILPYEEIEAALEVGRETGQQAVGAAKPELERLHNKAVVAIPNVGYRVVRPNEHMALAVVHQRKSVRALKRSLSKVNHVDAAQLTDGERAAVTLAATGIAMQLDYIRRNDIRAKRHEAMIAANAQKSERTADEVAEIKARLARLEGGES